MMALTLKHPWPYAICFLGKRIENRTWRPRPSQLQPGSYLAIHGGVIPKGRALTEASDDLQRLKAQGLCPDHVTLEETIMPGIADRLNRIEQRLQTREGGNSAIIQRSKEPSSN
jgi:hypothetical protein